MLRREIISKMLKIETGLKYIDKEEFKKYRLSLLEIRTLIHIQENDGIKPGDLAERFAVTPATMTVQVDRLVKKGYIEKIVNKDDKRAVNLSLTKKAKKDLNEIVKGKLKSFDIVFNSITDEEQKKLVEIMTKIENSLCNVYNSSK